MYWCDTLDFNESKTNSGVSQSGKPWPTLVDHVVLARSPKTLQTVGLDAVEYSDVALEVVNDDDDDDDDYYDDDDGATWYFMICLLCVKAIQLIRSW